MRLLVERVQLLELELELERRVRVVGQLDRVQLYLVVFAVWAAMLLWSKPWLARFRYGPLEWLWRCASRGSIQPIRGAAMAD